jgi:hypothetical protein
MEVNMIYRIIAYCWDNETPAAVIDLQVKENAWFLYHRYLEIGPDGRENIEIIELWEINQAENKSVQLSGCYF